MANYNVFVPARKGTDMPDMSIDVEASNWLVALKESLRQIGEQGDSLANIVCETAPDGSMRVADPGSKRVFIIRQVSVDEEDHLAAKATQQAAESRKLAEAAAKAKEETEHRLREVETQMSSTPAAVAAEEAAKAEAAQKLAEERNRLEAELVEAKEKLEVAALKAADQATGVLGSVKVQEVARKPEKKKAAAADEWDDLDDWYDGVEEEEEPIDSVVADLFLATDNLHEKEEQEASDFVLGLANKYVKAEAASIIYSDMNSALKDLIIVSASGPVGDKIIGIRIPLGQGIVGFSVMNGVRLTVNNVDKNPNFYGKLDQEFGFKTRSILCVPIQHQDRCYGAIELINKQGTDDSWSSYDSNVLESLAKILGRTIETNVALKGD